MVCNHNRTKKDITCLAPINEHNNNNRNCDTESLLTEIQNSPKNNLSAPLLPLPLVIDENFKPDNDNDKDTIIMMAELVIAAAKIIQSQPLNDFLSKHMVG